MGDLIEFPNLPIYTMDDDNNNYDDDDNDYDGSLTLYWKAPLPSTLTLSGIFNVVRAVPSKAIMIKMIVLVIMMIMMIMMIIPKSPMDLIPSVQIKVLR